MGSAYLFMPSNMLLLEVCVIGIPSFFLSLQHNNSRVEGKFITHVMSRAISGAVLMIICVMAMFLTHVFNDTEFGQFYVPMCMMALTLSGLVMLFRVCQPLNAYRLVLFLAMVGVSVTAYCVPFLSDMLYTTNAGVKFSELPWSLMHILIIAVVIEAAFPLSQSLIKIMQIIMPSATGKKKTEENETKKAA